MQSKSLLHRCAQFFFVFFADLFNTTRLKMEKLPELALIAVFDNLSLCDQIRMRSVCKQWKTIAENRLSCRRELVLFFNTIAVRPLVWFHSDRPVNTNSSVVVNKKFRKRKRGKFWPLFQKVKRLYVVGRLENFFLKRGSLQFTNSFRQLQHLQVDTVDDPPYRRFKKPRIQLNLRT